VDQALRILEFFRYPPTENFPGFRVDGTQFLIVQVAHLPGSQLEFATTKAGE
jgi:hypothetical protein